MKTRSQTLSRNNDEGTTGPQIATLGEAAGQQLDEARERIAEGAENARQKAENFLRSRPYRAVAIAIGVGALLGFILGRQSGED